MSYIPAVKPEKTFVVSKVVPPSMLYCNGAIPPTALIVIVPSITSHSVTFVLVTKSIAGASGNAKVTGLFG